MYVYIYMYVCMYVCMYMHACMYVCMYVTYRSVSDSIQYFMYDWFFILILSPSLSLFLRSNVSAALVSICLLKREGNGEFLISLWNLVCTA